MHSLLRDATARAWRWVSHKMHAIFSFGIKSNFVFWILKVTVLQIFFNIIFFKFATQESVVTGSLCMFASPHHRSSWSHHDYFFRKNIPSRTMLSCMLAKRIFLVFCPMTVDLIIWHWVEGEAVGWTSFGIGPISKSISLGHRSILNGMTLRT